MTDTRPRTARLEAPAAPTESAHTLLTPLGLNEVRVTGGFWAERQEANRTVSIPDGLRQLHEAQNLNNFAIAAGRAAGEAVGPIFADSDVYKWLEAAAWEYGREPDESLLAQQLEISELVGAAQEEDGYLNTVVRLREGQRYQNPSRNHEHYCAGHLFQAAVAQSRCTGEKGLLETAIRLADHLVRTFGPGRNEDPDGHPVVEMGLVELYRETGNRDYLDLARFFVEKRGHGTLERYDGNSTYLSDRVPVREAETVEGHAVRAVYLAAGAADVAVETDDDELLAALGTQYAHMAETKQYLTGGLGARWEGEAFGDPYELPSDRAYAETCAAIGAVQWAWRMLLATGEVGYAEQIERLLYNAFISGVSLTGREYFYVNPLQLRHDAHADNDRSPANGRCAWFGCACCPPNVMRTLSSLAGYVASVSDGDGGSDSGAGVQLHQLLPADLRVETAAGTLGLSVQTRYPWEGAVRITVTEAPADVVELSVRVPGWAQGATLDGRPVHPGAYASVNREFANGDVVELVLPLEPRLTHPNPRIDAVRGSVAIERGPLVYAVEAPDQDASVVIDDVALDTSAPLEASFQPDLLGGVTTIAARGSSGPLTAIPYFAWANRGPADMRVWIPEA